MASSQKQQDTAIIASNVNEKLIVLIAGIGMFLSTLDTGIINVALPSLVTEFHTNVTGITWTVTIYLMALSASIVTFGRLSDRYGHLAMYRWGLLVFAISSIAAGASFSLAQLILSRSLQGIGAAMLQATAAALITTLVAPERKGAALGTLGIMIGLGPVLGPAVGGIILSSIGWRWIFWLNIPFCLLGLYGCSRLAVRSVSERKTPLDVPGNVLFIITMIALLYGLSNLSGAALSLYQVFLPLLIFGIGLILFLFREARTSSPLLDLGLFRSSFVAVPLLATASFGAATAVVFILPPYFLENITHLAPWQVGYIALSAPLGLAIVSRFSGKAIKRQGTSRLMLFGLSVMFAALVLLGIMQLGWSPILFVPFLFLYGVGGGIFQPPNIAGVMEAVGLERQGTIGAIQRMVQNVAIALGAALSAVFIQSYSGAGVGELLWGFRSAWIFAGALILMSMLSFGVLLARRRSRS